MELFDGDARSDEFVVTEFVCLVVAWSLLFHIITSCNCNCRPCYWMLVSTATSALRNASHQRYDWPLLALLTSTARVYSVSMVSVLVWSENENRFYNKH